MNGCTIEIVQRKMENLQIDEKMDGSVGGWVGAWLDVSHTESLTNLIMMVLK